MAKLEFNHSILKAVKGKLMTFETEEDINTLALSKNAVNGEIIADIVFLDKDMITDDQRKKVFALIGDVSDYTGYPVDVMYEKMKFYYMAYSGCDTFSLARNAVTKEFASRFIEFCIEWCFQMEIPFKYREYHLTADVSRTLFLYLKYRCCFVCGKPHSDIHHATNLIGMGNNRKNHNHLKSTYMCLCRSHHEEVHHGLEVFCDKYHLKPIKINEETAISLGLTTKRKIETFKERGV